MRTNDERPPASGLKPEPSPQFHCSACEKKEEKKELNLSIFLKSLIERTDIELGSIVSLKILGESRRIIGQLLTSVGEDFIVIGHPIDFFASQLTINVRFIEQIVREETKTADGYERIWQHNYEVLGREPWSVYTKVKEKK